LSYSPQWHRFDRVTGTFGMTDELLKKRKNR